MDDPSTLDAPYDPHGAALLDCYRGRADVMLICHQDGVRDDVPAAFWLRDDMDPLESAAIDLCRGRVLDVGAGAGLHALALQARGLAVTAIDISPACGEVLRARGVRDVRVANLFSFEGGPFDTIACLCNGLDKVGRLPDLPHFLERMRNLLAPGGQLLADSFDIRVGASPERRAALEARAASGRYFGEMDLRLEYGGRSGAPFSVLQVDFGTLARVAEAGGWRVEFCAGDEGHYLARLTPWR